jgi:membrane-associated phospholipid phosphatase
MYGAMLLLAMHTAGAAPTPTQPAPASQAADERRLYPIPADDPPAALVRPGSKPDVVFRWNEMILTAIKTDRTPPPMAARNLAIIHAAIYDAVNSIYRTHRAYHVDAKPRGETSAEAAAAVAAHRVLVVLYPRQVERFDEALDESLDSIPEGPAKENGIALGQDVAEQILAWRRTDGYSLRVAHSPRRIVGAWQPTSPGYRPALLPQWPRLTCFAMRNGAQFRPADPPALTSAAYTDSFQEAKSLGAAASTTRTPEQTEIALFWADGDGTTTPPGHWNRIARSVAVARGNSLADNARLLALLNIALADAAIVSWDCKFKYDFWRPISAIRNADLTGNPDTIADPEWTPLIRTPPFPSYTSGHSTFSSAAAAVLAYFFGSDDVRFTSTSEGLPGVTRSFSSFSAAAAEAGMSRIYGGIHWSFDNTAGLASGRDLGIFVSQNYLRPRAD